MTSLMDGFGQSLMKYLRQKELLVLVVCFTAFLLGIPHVMQVHITNHCVRHPIMTIVSSIDMLKGLSVQVGIYVFQLMDHYTAIVSIMFLAFFEVVATCWIYGKSCHVCPWKCMTQRNLKVEESCFFLLCILEGLKRLSDNLEEMTGNKPNVFFKVCWTVVSPLLVTVSHPINI